MKPGDIVVNMWLDLDDPDRIGIAREVKKRRDTVVIESVRIVPTGKKHEAVSTPRVTQWLVVGRAGKKAGR